MESDKTLSPEDYKRLLSIDWNLWTEDELSQFLVWDFLNAFSKMGLAKDIVKTAEAESGIFLKKYKKYIFIFKIIDKLFQKTFSILGWKKTLKKIYFQNISLKFTPLIRAAQKYYSIGIIVQGKKDRLFAIKNFINYIGTTDLNQCVHDYLANKDTKNLYNLVEKAEDRLKVAKPDFIIFGLDVLPIERAIILAARKMSIPTIVIQDGVYDSNFPLFECNVADYILFWGEHFKDLWISRNKKRPENSYVLGYPYLINKNYELKTNDSHLVCYLGQDFERYNRDNLIPKLETIKAIYEICKNLGLKFIYRPHPGDDRAYLSKNLLDVQFTREDEKIEESLNRADIFISLNSTALIEAAMRSKIALQLMDFPIKSDNLEELGVCNKSFKTIEELENYLGKIAGASDMNRFKLRYNNDYIETRYEPGRRFLEIMKEIEKNK